MEFILKKRVMELGLVLLFLILVTGVIWWTDADKTLALLVRGEHKINPIGRDFWPAGEAFPWAVLYRWAALPVTIMGGVALIVLLAGFFRSAYAGWRIQVLYILLFLALGPGLVVNFVLKDHLGRARPREVIEYGGSLPFTQIWQHGAAGGNSSFPSGHAAIAFSLIAPWFIYRERRKKVAWIFLSSGLSYGSLIGLTRILQGGHFLSDVMWSGGIVYLVGGSLALVMRIDSNTSINGQPFCCADLPRRMG